MPKVASNEAHSEEDPAHGATPESVAEALSHLEVANIFPTEIEASLAGPPSPIHLVETDVDIDYLSQEGLFSNRFSWTVRMLGDSDQGSSYDDPEMNPDLIASFRFTFQVDYSTDEGYRVPDPEAIAVTRTTGLFAAYPYTRELLQNLTSRLQLDPIVLGMLVRGEIRPAGVTKVDRERAW